MGLLFHALLWSSLTQYELLHFIYRAKSLSQFLCTTSDYQLYALNDLFSISLILLVIILSPSFYTCPLSNVNVTHVQNR